MSIGLENEIFSWHKPQWVFINHALKHHRLPAALLLTGPQGLGKTIFAKQLAKRLLCKHPHDIQACNDCESCLQFDSANHPDYYELGPSEKVKSISIDDIRDLSVKLQKSAHQQGYQVVIFNPMSTLTSAAGHALLKTLEEPMGQVIMIGVLSEPNQILETLNSRMVNLPFFATASQNGIDISHALYGDAPLLLKSIDTPELNQLTLDVLNHVGKSMVPKVNALQMPNQWFKEDALHVIKILYCLCKDCIQLQLAMPIECCVFGKYPDKINYISNLLSMSHWFAMLEEVGKNLAAAQHATAFNLQYMIEGIMIKLQRASMKHKGLVS